MRVQNLFYTNDPEASTLHRRITPTTEQRLEQQTRWNDLCDFLIGDLSEKTGLSTRSWLQGSYKFGTQTRPARKSAEFDIDLGIYFEWSGSPYEGDLSPGEVKELVQQSLREYQDEAGDDVIEVVEPSKERCARIRFTGSFHIDVPAYHLNPDQDARSLATENNGWEESDPKAFYVWFLEQFEDEDHAQVRRLIRYVKMWAALKLGAPPSSVMLTVLVAQAYVDLSVEDAETDDLALQGIARAILERLNANPRVLNPINGSENLNRLSPEDMASFLIGLEALIASSNFALDAETETEAALIWGTVFEQFFPMPDPPASEERALVPVGFEPQVNVVATPPTGTVRFRGTNRIGPIPKKCSIEFTLTNAHELPQGARVEWVVRNEGHEAELTNDLGHLAGTGVLASENSAYRGTHYMDVVVTSMFGRVLGFKRIPVQIMDIEMPPRNPLRRPGYTRYRRNGR